ncbi:MAG: metal-dependent hydrolase [Methanobacteriaceae archaeon]
MPDLLAHIAIAYIVCRILYFKYPMFNSANTVLAMLGSLLPDISKLGVVVHLFSTHIFEYNLNDYIYTFHTPLASLVLAGLIAIFFQEKKSAFLFLSLGVFTHYLLDLLLIQVGGGYFFLFPFSWQIFHLDLLPPDGYKFTLVLVIVAISLFLLGKFPKINFNNL